jgi:hypothetical protein
LETAHTALEKE